MQSVRLKVGAVSYLNSKPLVHRLAELTPQADISYDYPSRLADDLAAGRLDVALIPSIECLRGPAYRIVSDACIACRGPVLSVKLFSRVPPPQVRTLALDEGSRTSAALAQILLRERYGIRPELRSLPLGATIADSPADAVLLIGDRAIQSVAGRFAEVWDLGDQWYRWSGLPFVFAMWVARPNVDLGDLATAFAQARDAGLAAADQIAEHEAAQLGLTVPQCLAYLRDNLHFYLGSQERQGLELFRQKAAALGLVSQTIPPPHSPQRKPAETGKL